jgi:hypothetical protein
MRKPYGIKTAIGVWFKRDAKNRSGFLYNGAQRRALLLTYIAVAPGKDPNNEHWLADVGEREGRLIRVISNAPEGKIVKSIPWYDPDSTWLSSFNTALQDLPAPSVKWLETAAKQCDWSFKYVSDSLEPGEFGREACLAVGDFETKKVRVARSMPDNIWSILQTAVQVAAATVIRRPPPSSGLLAKAFVTNTGNRPFLLTVKKNYVKCPGRPSPEKAKFFPSMKVFLLRTIKPHGAPAELVTSAWDGDNNSARTRYCLSSSAV